MCRSGIISLVYTSPWWCSCSFSESLGKPGCLQSPQEIKEIISTGYKCLNRGCIYISLHSVSLQVSGTQVKYSSKDKSCYRHMSPVLKDHRGGCDRKRSGEVWWARHWFVTVHDICNLFMTPLHVLAMGLMTDLSYEEAVRRELTYASFLELHLACSKC